MQSLARPAGRRPIVQAASSLSSTSRFASSWSPLGWVREKLAPGVQPKWPAREEGNTNVFEALPQAVIKKTAKALTKREAATEHKYSTANFKISHRKLNMLANQIGSKPVDYALLQMQFSEKRAGRRIMNMLATAKDHAIRYKKMDPSRLVVSQAWVTKGPRPPKMIEPRGRGHHGVRVKSNAKMSVILGYGKSIEEKKAEAFQKKLNKVVSASAMAREDVPLRNPVPKWTW
ncbi:50S ribosomal protein L22 [Coprinopsis sp. MPI-PUGE-AT-0042]|nr:50S ribosomal protein L22 [Coprinopsis sp. MPI-PUGE-AT-0042]